MTTRRPRVTVLVPVFDQRGYLPCALGSLLDQDETDWEAVVLGDGSTDGTSGTLASWPRDVRVRVAGWRDNRGLGATLNAGLALARAPVVAYLPADDVWYRHHLTPLLAALAVDDAVPAVSGVRYHGDQRALSSGRTTPASGTKAIRESFDGGLNVFRGRYRVAQPLRFHSSDSGTTDEVERYRRFRERRYEPSLDRLWILLVGHLAFNPERVLALAERGHRLYGLWTPDPLGDSTVGPLPFGHVEELPQHG